MDAYEARARHCDSMQLIQTFLAVIERGVEGREQHRKVMDFRERDEIMEIESKQIGHYAAYAVASERSYEVNRCTFESVTAGRLEAEARHQDQMAGLEGIQAHIESIGGHVLDHMMAGKSHAEALASKLRKAIDAIKTNLIFRSTTGNRSETKERERGNGKTRSVITQLLASIADLNLA